MENYIHYQFIGKEINDPIFNSFKAISTKKSFNSSSQYFSSYDKGISLYFEDNKSLYYKITIKQKELQRFLQFFLFFVIISMIFQLN